MHSSLLRVSCRDTFGISQVTHTHTCSSCVSGQVTLSGRISWNNTVGAIAREISIIALTVNHEHGKNATFVSFVLRTVIRNSAKFLKNSR